MARRNLLDLQLDLQSHYVASKKQPFSLQHLCRKIIIVYIMKSVGLFNVHKACARLPIPKIIVNYLTNSSSKDEHFDIRTWGSLVELGYSGKCLLYGELVTLKCIDLRRKLGRLRTEAIRFKEKWMSVEHENISKAIVCFEAKDIMGAIFEPCSPSIKDIVTQYCDMNERIAEENIWKVLNQLCSALMYLSKHNISHHKLCSKVVSVTTTWDVRVQNQLMHYSANESLTPLQEMYYGVYLAPERIEGRPCKDKQDTWLVGCIAYEMVHKETAFRGSEGTSLFETLNNIVEGRPPPRLSDSNGYSNDLINVTRSCLTHLEQLRPPLEQVYRVIEDKFNGPK
jgi:hypothetical protein